jgi:hypothetical protein
MLKTERITIWVTPRHISSKIAKAATRLAASSTGESILSDVAIKPRSSTMAHVPDIALLRRRSPA